MRIGDGFFGSGKKVGPDSGPSPEWIKKAQNAFDDWMRDFISANGREPTHSEYVAWQADYIKKNPY